MVVEDHLRLYRCLKKEGVKYIVIGGVAAIAYGVPRTTNDIDIFIKPTVKNCENLLKALEGTGLVTAYLTTAQKLSEAELTIIEDVIRMDILTKAKGLDFEKCWNKRVVKKISGVPVNFIALNDLIQAKKSVGRKIDIEDVHILKKIRRLSS